MADKDETKPGDRKFVTLFDGDEIDGKRYGLGCGVTGLDEFTIGFLIKNGRIREVDDKAFEKLDGPDASSGPIDDDLDVTVAKLKEIAEDEEVDLEGLSRKGDIQGAIMAKRAESSSS